MIQIKKLLSEMVATSSIYPDEKKLAGFLEGYLRNAGFNVTRQKISARRYNLFAEKGRGETSILFYGHLDTVNSLQLGWKSNPFQLTEKNNRWYGLGTFDMKGGIAAFLHAAHNTKRKVKIFLAVDEENISLGAWRAIHDRKEFFNDVSLIISAEPNFENELNNLAIGRVGRCVFEINFQGVPVHASQFTKGIDAIELLGKFVHRFYTERKRLFKSRYSFGLVRVVEGQAQGMSVCGQAQVEVEVFLGPEDTIENILTKVQSLTEGKVSIKSRETPYLGGYKFGTFPLKRQIGEIIQKRTSEKMKFHLRSSVGDDNVLATLGIPVISWGPSGGNAHAANEYVIPQSLETLFLMYQDVLELTVS